MTKQCYSINKLNGSLKIFPEFSLIAMNFQKFPWVFWIFFDFSFFKNFFPAFPGFIWVLWTLHERKLFFKSIESSVCTAQKMKLSCMDLFSKCDQIRSFIRIWSHLLKKSFIENFIFCVVKLFINWITPRHIITQEYFCDQTTKLLKI